MGQALYRTYRSKKLSEIIGQEHITDTLGQALKTGNISHAYLFTGPRGTGKTSIARILAHQINGLPYTDDSMHIDIIEIDAASNRRIDEIRELRDKVYVAPTSAKYKVYIIDEVHMLTREAFNALLKTLEEPPAHVVFILATTDSHKLPATIISRTQRFSFKPVEQAKVVAHLKTIAAGEQIEIDDQALELIAAHGEGSFRDSISLLDQASNLGKQIKLEDVQSLLGMASDAAIEQLTALIGSDSDPASVLTALSGLYDQGYQAAAIASQLAAKLRASLITGKPALETNQLLALLSKLLNVASAHDPERFLEISLLQVLPTDGAPVIQTIKKQEPIIVPESIGEAAPQAIEQTEPQSPEVEVVEEPRSKPNPQPAQGTAVLDEASWPQVLQALKKQYNTLYGVVRMAQPTFHEDGSLELAFDFAFHQKRVNEAKNRQILMDIVKQITGTDVELICIVSKDKAQKTTKTSTESPSTEQANPLSTISNIFGGGELLE